jgi:hypothetical protein
VTFPIPNVAADRWLTNMRTIVAEMPAVLGRYPDARIVRNEVGNLAILDSDGDYVGYIGLLVDHGINLFDDQAGSPA